MGKNHRATGSHFEYKVRDKLMKEGHFVVRQAASAFPDIIAITPSGHVKMIECKTSKDPKKPRLKKYEKEELIRLKNDFNVSVYFGHPRYSTYSKRSDNVILDPL